MQIKVPGRLRFDLLRSFLVIVLCSIGYIPLSAQKEANIWYFGRNAGLDFSSGSPKVLHNGKVNTNEGSASICDKDGKLLFYTDGTTVYNRFHEVMPNGTGLRGHASSTQSAFIVPYPGHDGLYYLFTITAQGGSDGLCYSVVDVRANNGKGDIPASQKNIVLKAAMAEKIAAVHHANGSDIWILAQEFGTNIYHKWLLTEAGLSSRGSQVIGTVAAKTEYGNAGYMKFAPSGSKMVTAMFDGGVQLFDFDNKTGGLSHPRVVINSSFSYGMEFSASEKFLYISNHQRVLQFDISLPSETDIAASKTVLYENPYETGFGAMQMGPDGVIYVVFAGKNKVSVIRKPEVKGLGCGFAWEALDVSLASTALGLPSFLSDIYLPPLIEHQYTCLGDVTELRLSSRLKNVQSATWDFGDKSDRTSASGLSVSHRFGAPGTYTVLCYVKHDNQADTLKKLITINPLPQVELGKDTVICHGGKFRLQPSIQNATSWRWSDGSTDSTLFISHTGVYTLEASNADCSVIDSIKVYVLDEISLPKDTELCQGSALSIRMPELPGMQYHWPDGSTGSSYSVTQPQSLWMTASNGSCAYTDTMQVSFSKPLQIKLGADTMLCPGESLVLHAPAEARSVTWQDGSHGYSFTVTKPGTYTLEATNACGRFTGKIRVDYYNFSLNLGPDTFVCENNSLLLTAGDSLGYTYFWSDGSTRPTLLVTEAGQYTVIKKGDCGILSDTINITREDCSCPVYLPNAFSPNDDKLNDNWKPIMCPARQYELVIYNRWGEEVFRTQQQATGWDGRMHGQYVPDGTYVYALKALTRYGFHLYRTGSIYVLR